MRPARRSGPRSVVVYNADRHEAARYAEHGIAEAAEAVIYIPVGASNCDILVFRRRSPGGSKLPIEVG